MIFDVNPSQAQAKISELIAEFPDAKIQAMKVDITDDAAVSLAVEKTAEILGSVEILLCFAGVVGCYHALEMTSAQFRRTIDINTTGNFLVAQAVAKQMVKQGGRGSITFVASISGHMVNYPQPQAAYNVSKAAVLSLKNCLATEWARYGIRVNSISPGYMDTILNEGEGIEKSKQSWRERNPSGRLGVASELTGAVILLSSNAGTYINGMSSFSVLMPSRNSLTVMLTCPLGTDIVRIPIRIEASSAPRQLLMLTFCRLLMEGRSFIAKTSRAAIEVFRHVNT